MEFLKHTLPNGLEVVAERNSHAHSTAVGFFVQTGARDESDEIAGVSHFLEHMVFKGTPARSGDDVNREFDEMGAHYNAFTSEENTVYYAAVLPEHQTHAVELLGDIMRPSLRTEDFDTEKQVIIEEIRMYEDQPPFGGDEKCKAAYFGEHPLGRSVLGSIESIANLRVEQMRDYFRQRYSPRNISLVGAGSIDFDELVRSAERICGGWESVATTRDCPRAAGNSGFVTLHKDTAALEYVLQLASAPGCTDDDRYAAKILATIVGDDSGSRLYWELVDTGHAEQATVSHYDYQGTGAFMTYMSCEAELAGENIARIQNVFQQLEQQGVTAAELAQAKSKLNSRVVLSSERPRGRLFNVGGNWLQRREYRTVQQDLETVESVTIEELREVLRRYPLSRNTTVAIGPLAELTPAG